MSDDLMTKDVFMQWLAGVPDDANLWLEMGEDFGQLYFIALSANGQQHTLTIGVVFPIEQIDPETN